MGTEMIAGLSPAMVTVMTGVLTFVAVYGGLAATFPQTGAGRTRNFKHLAGMRKDVRAGAIRKHGDKRKSLQDQVRAMEEKRKKPEKVSLGDLLSRADMSIGAGKYYLVFGMIAFGVAFVLFFAGAPVFVIPVVIPLFLIIMPRKVAKFMIARRQKKFIENFAAAIDVLVRGVRTGLPVGDGLRLIAREIPEPVAGEFRRLTESLAVGVTLEDALRRMYDRMPLPEVNFFAIVLIIQKSTGGNLAEALGNLSVVIRDRKKLKGKIKALSSEAKASAMIIGSLPFALGLILFVVSPDYIALLFTERLGNYMMLGGLTWMGMGVFVMAQMINIDI